MSNNGPLKLVLVVAAVGLFALLPKSKETESAAAAPIVHPPAVGAHMTNQYFEYVRDAARFECEAALKKTATYGLRVAGEKLILGLDPPLTPTRINKFQLANGRVTLWGDDVEVQTEFGRWIVANYSCEWDPASKRVVDARFALGKLPQSFGRE
jgi:hypothetical protein